MCSGQRIKRAIVVVEDRYGISPKALANLGVAVGRAELTALDLTWMAEGPGADRAENDDWVDA
jgi:hypothetical protein